VLSVHAPLINQNLISSQLQVLGASHHEISGATLATRRVIVLAGQYGEAMDDVVELVEDTYGLDRRERSARPWRRLLRSTIHFFSYNFILKRRTTRVTRAAGFRLLDDRPVFTRATSSRANSSHPISGGSIQR